MVIKLYQQKPVLFIFLLRLVTVIVVVLVFFFCFFFSVVLEIDRAVSHLTSQSSDKQPGIKRTCSGCSKNNISIID